MPIIENSEEVVWNFGNPEIYKQIPSETSSDFFSEEFQSTSE